MDSFIAKHVFLTICVVISFMRLVGASDPEILSDFIVPHNVKVVDGNFFTYTKTRDFFNGSTNPTSMQASFLEFPALNGQSVSLSLLRLAPGGVSAPHIRPYATGLFLVLEGRFEVGFVDTTNKLYTQTLKTGDMFIFPKGLIHYQYNADKKKVAVGVAAFGSASTALVSVPATLFQPDIDDVVLAKSFKTDVAVIQKLRSDLRGKV